MKPPTARPQTGNTMLLPLVCSRDACEETPRAKVGEDEEEEELQCGEICSVENFWIVGVDAGMACMGMRPGQVDDAVIESVSAGEEMQHPFDSPMGF